MKKDDFAFKTYHICQWTDRPIQTLKAVLLHPTPENNYTRPDQVLLHIQLKNYRALCDADKLLWQMCYLDLFPFDVICDKVLYSSPWSSSCLLIAS